jgi:4-hydroxybenzoate polyprenyltransferase
MHNYIELMRLNKPIGIWLLFFPAAWAVAFAGPANADSLSTSTLLIIMFIGAVLMRSAGCIINDLTDRKLDSKVARTSIRPLASGTIKPWQAILLLIVLLLLAFVTACTLPPTWFPLAVLALPLIVLYPWMKRLTWWPQLFLGLTFNLGVLFGWVATDHALHPASFILYLACICWTLGYDTIYAVQDMADDTTAGIRSTARRIGTAHLRIFVAACYGVMLALLALSGYLLHAPFPYYIALFAAAAQLLWQVRQLPCTPDRAAAIFRSNQWTGLILLIGLLASRAL